jgi:hypothetical protein
MKSYREIEKEVMNRYPVTSEEKGCRRIKQRMDFLRHGLRQRIEDDEKRKKEIQQANGINQ